MDGQNEDNPHTMDVSSDDLQPTWNFKPAPQTENLRTSNVNPVKRPFFSTSSASFAQPLDEESILRSRRPISSKPSRLLDLKRDKVHHSPDSISSRSAGTAHTITQSAARLFDTSEKSQNTRKDTTSTGFDADQAAQFRVFDFASSTNLPPSSISLRRKSLHERVKYHHLQQGSHDEMSPLQTLSTAPGRDIGNHGHTEVSSTNIFANSSGMNEELDAKEHSISRRLSGKPVKAEELENATISSRGSSTSVGPIDAKGIQGVVIEAMKTIERYEVENNAHKAEIGRLNARLTTEESENIRLQARIESIKGTSLEKLKASSKTLESLGNELEYLKRESIRTFESVDEARSLIEDVHELKSIVTETIQGAINHRVFASERFLGEGSENMMCDDEEANLKTKEILSELKLDNENKQQVLDMLRDRLTEAMGDLANERSHLYEVQEAYAQECRTTQQVLVNLRNTELDIDSFLDERLLEVSAELKLRHAECLDYAMKLAEMETELCETKARISDLSSVSEELEHALRHNSSLEARIREKDMSVKALEDKLEDFSGLEESIASLKTKIVSKEAEIERLKRYEQDVLMFRDENVKLQTMLEQQQEQLKVVEAEQVKKAEVYNRNSELKVLLDERESRINALESTDCALRLELEKTKALLSKIQTQFDNAEGIARRLRAELLSSKEKESSATATEATLKATKDALEKEKMLLERHLNSSERELKTVQENSEKMREHISHTRFTQTNMRLHSLQERFEEQGITLRLTRDSNAELQDRLVNTSTDYAKALEANTAPLRTQIAVLQEQKAFLETQLKQRDLASEKVTKEYDEITKESTAKENALTRQLADERKSFEASSAKLQTQLAVCQERNTSVQNQLEESKTEIQRLIEAQRATEFHWQERVEDIRRLSSYETEQSATSARTSESNLEELRTQIKTSQALIKELQAKIDKTPAPCVGHEEKIQELSAQVAVYCTENHWLKERIESIATRYDKGDLDAQERGLVKKVMEATQSMHDQHMAQFLNEICRKDEQINSLQEAKVALENSLAKYIEENKIAAAQTRSVLDFVNWPSSQSELSSLRSFLPVQDGDQPSTAPEDPQDEEPEDPRPSFVDIASYSRSHPGAKRSLPPLITTVPPAAVSNFVSPTLGTSKEYFSKLAPDLSDDIAVFEDADTPPTDKKQLEEEEAAKSTVEQSRPAKRTVRCSLFPAMIIRIETSEQRRTGSAQMKAQAEPKVTTNTTKAKRKRRS
ncbi:hypothetical protein M422DRAFT_40468 [Sphaerobolus stellatus SS14]|nr:hypothetical protein M422DRAFT_40468 [Sphaerobolus stellatus SS14]